MKKSTIKSIVTLAILFSVGCASTPAKNQKEPKSVATYFNPDPAPEKMSPPQLDGDPVVDPTHVRTQADYHYSLGEAYSLEGNSERAIEEFKLVTVYDPQSATVRLRLAGEYLRQGLLTESVEQAEQSLQIDPANTDVRIFLGGLYAALKMYKQALEQYEKVMVQNPNDQEVPIYIGALYAEQGRIADAEKQFLKVAANPKSEKVHMAHYYLGKLQAAQMVEKGSTPEKNQYAQKAEKAFMASLHAKPDFEDGALALFEVYEFQNKKEKGAVMLESFQEKFGPKKSVAYELGQYYLDKEKYDKAFKHLRVLEGFEPNNLNVKVKIALILIEQKKYDEAIDKLEEVIRVTPSSDKIRFYLAAVYEEVGNTDWAIKNFKKIEPSSTYYPDAIVHAAYLYRKKADLDGALKLMTEAISKRDDVPQFYSFYATILDERKDYSRGVALLEKAIVKFPDNTQLRFYLGSMYDKIGKQDNTVAELRRVLAIEPDHVQALNYLAYTYAEQGKNLEEAEKLGRHALELQPNDPYILDTVGWIMFKQGRTEDAIQYLEAAHKAKPDEAIVAEHLGDAYYVFELTDKARAMYNKAIESEEDGVKRNKIQAKIQNMKTGAAAGRVPASAK